MDWIPVVFIVFKLSVIGTAMFFSIKSHRDKQKEEQEEERLRQSRAALLAGQNPPATHAVRGAGAGAAQVDGMTEAGLRDGSARRS